MNSTLGNIGKTHRSYSSFSPRSGDDAAMAGLVEKLHRGEVHTLIMYGVNPGYDYPDAGRFLEGLDKLCCPFRSLTAVMKPARMRTLFVPIITSWKPGAMPNRWRRTSACPSR